jgi:hypothetical protein
MKRIVYVLLSFVFLKTVCSQQIYFNGEDAKLIVFKTWTGQLDSMFANPDTTGIDTTKYCGRYKRNSEPYDNIKIVTYARLLDVNSYASESPMAPKIKMKIYTSMPAGSKIHLQLGTKSDDNYPSGIHSEFWATTKVVNEWEELEFNFSELTPGGHTDIEDIDKVILIINPGSLAQDVFYFDDLKGPQLDGIGFSEPESEYAVIYNNYPNPAEEETKINFSIKKAGLASLTIYDALGKEVMSLVDQELAPGNYSVPVETSGLSNGVYYCTLRCSGLAISSKMAVAR